MSRHHFGEGALAGAIFTHDRVNLPFGYFQIETFEDLAFTDVCVQVLNIQAHEFS